MKLVKDLESLKDVSVDLEATDEDGGLEKFKKRIGIVNTNG